MTNQKRLLIVAALSCFLNSAWAGPCEQITQACLGAGFVKGEAKVNKGLMRDCVNPIMQSKSVAGAPPLPAVDPALIPACHAKHPQYGMGKVGK
jgi:hypothetical protein